MNPTLTLPATPPPKEKGHPLAGSGEPEELQQSNGVNGTPIITLFASCRETTGTPISMAAFLEGVTAPSPETATKIKKIRGLVRDGKKKDADNIKQTLPAVTLSGSFYVRNADQLEEHSGVVALDLDGMDEAAIASARQKLENDPHVAFAFVSPSGRGVKGGCRVPVCEDGADHTAAWLACGRYFQETHGLTLDQSGKDVSRLCFVSHDADTFVNWQAEELDVEKWRELAEVPTAPVAAVTEEKQTYPNPDGWVILPSGTVGNLESARTCFDALLKSGVFFRRGGRVLELDNNALDVVVPQRLRSGVEDFAVVAKWLQDRNGKWVLSPSARTSADNALMMLASPAANILPQIESVTSAPPLVEIAPGVAGVSCMGYSRETKTFVTGGASIDVCEHDVALELLDTLLGEFDFVSPADRSRAIAAIITPALVAGNTLGGHAPMFVVEADDSQAGKGYLLELIQSLFGEAPSLVSQKAGGVGGFDESLSAALVGGRPFIQLDNIRGKISSQFLEMVLTCPVGATVPCRLPYKGEVQVNPSRVIWQLTSNGVAATQDLANRCCIVRIKKRKNFAFRQFPEGSLADHVAANRGRFLGSVYAIAALWIQAGKPRTTDTRGQGRFRQWAQSLDWIVGELCESAPLMDGHEAVQTRAATPALSWLRELGLKIVEQQEAGTEWTATTIGELSAEEGIPVPGGGENDDDSRRTQATGRALGRVFKASSEVAVDGISVTKTVREATREGRGTYAAKIYFFAVSPLATTITTGH